MGSLPTESLPWSTSTPPQVSPHRTAVVQCGRLRTISRFSDVAPVPTIGLRHSCEIGDDMASYGWTEYDTRIGGKQILSDRGMKIDIETEFIKVPAQNGKFPESGILRLGGNWGVRIKGRPKNRDSITNIFFYAGLEGFGDLHLANKFSPDVTSPLTRIDDRASRRILSWKDQLINSATLQLRSQKDLSLIGIPCSLIRRRPISISRYMLRCLSLTNKYGKLKVDPKQRDLSQTQY